MTSKLDEYVKNVLIDYVKDQVLDKKREKIIYNFCMEQPSLSITVYRGHGKSQTIRPGLWYSTTTDINVANNDFSGKNCCIFIIHLLNVPCIDINSLIGYEIGDKKTEKEIIFLGEGTFYKNSNLTEEGFLELGNKNKFNKYMFECWYSLSNNYINENANENDVLDYKNDINLLNINNVERALNIIDPNEYDFITNIDDIMIDNIELTDKEKQQIVDEIQKRKQIIGGKYKKIYKKNNTTKRKTPKKIYVKNITIKSFRKKSKYLNRKQHSRHKIKKYKYINRGG